MATWRAVLLALVVTGVVGAAADTLTEETLVVGDGDLEVEEEGDWWGTVRGFFTLQDEASPEPTPAPPPRSNRQKRVDNWQKPKAKEDPFKYVFIVLIILVSLMCAFTVWKWFQPTKPPVKVWKQGGGEIRQGDSEAPEDPDDAEMEGTNPDGTNAGGRDRAADYEFDFEGVTGETNPNG
eukprot:TRINITY_DN28411_c0_g1_i1.p1 TRINITY_DN28411_c0_g1~~TRINITY_DN28411_c0_g1_i1.p1  ORF type:complete len:200 (+),score=68.57 TRINITY_DN28411_c0_g1_i1:61-600(+)